MSILISQALAAIDKPSTGMTFVRKFGPAPKTGCTLVAMVTLLAVPDEDAAMIKSEWHSPAIAGHREDAILLYVSTSEGKSVSDISRGCDFSSIVVQPIWRF